MISAGAATSITGLTSGGAGVDGEEQLARRKNVFDLDEEEEKGLPGGFLDNKFNSTTSTGRGENINNNMNSRGMNNRGGGGQEKNNYRTNKNSSYNKDNGGPGERDLAETYSTL